MSTNHQLPEQPVRSKGQATLQPDTHAEVFATIRDISPTGIGVESPQPLSPGTFVQIDIHGHAAQGVVQTCDVQDGKFQIGIVFDEPASPESLS